MCVRMGVHVCVLGWAFMYVLRWAFMCVCVRVGVLVLGWAFLC